MAQSKTLLGWVFLAIAVPYGHAQGEVYKSRDQVLTVEGYHVHEAYLVVASDELMGFYLPVEHNFAPISPTRHLHIAR